LATAQGPFTAASLIAIASVRSHVFAGARLRDAITSQPRSSPRAGRVDDKYVSEIGAPLVELRRRPGGHGAATRSYTASETAVLLLAGLAFMDGLIHVGVAVQSGSEPARYAVALALVAAMQVCSAAILLWRPCRSVLLFVGACNVAIIALLLVARTAGVVIAALPWAPGAVDGLHGLFWCAASLPGAHPGAGAGVANLVETVGQLATITGVLSVAASARLAIARRVVARISPVLAAVLFLSVLYGFGAQAG
jgi:hypothetical protein